MKTTTVDLPNNLDPDKDYYLIAVLDRYGEYENHRQLFMEIDKNIDAEGMNQLMHKAAQFDIGGDEDDWDEEIGGYWFDGNLMELPSVLKKLTTEEACVIAAARDLGVSL